MASDYVVVGRAIHEGRSFEVVRCRRDAVEFANAEPAPKVAEIQASLDSLYGTLRNDVNPRAASFVDRVASVVSATGTLHDEGCGNGQIMLEARRRGWTVQGNDIVPTVRLAIEAQGMKCFTGTLPELHLPPESCDVVTSYCVIPHCADPRRELDAICALLKPGGLLVAEMPTNGLYRRTAKILFRLAMGRWRTILAQIYQPGGHQFAFEPRSVEQLARQVGFRDVWTESFFADPRLSLDRFRRLSLGKRVAASVVVRILALVSRQIGRPNHMILFARKPS